MMKRLLICILAAMPLLFVSCKKDDKSNVKDPNNDVGYEWIVYENNETTYHPCMIFQDGNLLCSEDNSYIGDAWVSDFGQVNSLKEVNSVPSDWKKSIKIQIGHGYVFKYRKSYISGYVYSRIRVLEHIDKGSVTGYRIRFQDEWDPLIDE